jgi:alanine racemase
MATADPACRAGAVLEIDLAAIVENWRMLARLAAPARCAAVVKANAYGLGAAPGGRALLQAGCGVFFVATLDEGIALRRALGGAPEIAVLNGPRARTEGEFVEHALVPVLNEPGQIAAWRNAAGEGPPPPAMLHLDTGMARLGLTARELAALLEAPPPIGWRLVISHLASADEAGHGLNPRQRREFAAAASRFPGVPASLAASSGIFLGPQYHFDLVRPGAALYGVNPRPQAPNPLRPVVRLSARILQVREIDRGQSVGYGAAHVMPAPGRVETVAVGYAEGWLRSMRRRGSAQVGGTRVPLLGRVSMDLASFDVSAVDPALVRPGMMVELLGPAYGVDAAAADAGTIGYEILTALGARHHRVYRHAAPADPPE